MQNLQPQKIDPFSINGQTECVLLFSAHSVYPFLKNVCGHSILKQKGLEFEGFRPFLALEPLQVALSKIQIHNLNRNAKKYLVRLKKDRKWLKRGPYLFIIPPVKFQMLRITSVLELLLKLIRLKKQHLFKGHGKKSPSLTGYLYLIIIPFPTFQILPSFIENLFTKSQPHQKER